jgi:cyclomaltodextrinase
MHYNGTSQNNDTPSRLEKGAARRDVVLYLTRNHEGARNCLDAFRTPAWVHDAVFYQIFPDRFARSDRVHKPRNLEAWDSPPTERGFKGGDLLGVAERLGYLADLGVTALYFTPVFQSAANHRYHTHDYLQVDPILGGDGALRELLDAAHRRGMRVVLDGVFNHASRGLFQFHHILENGPQSPYTDWFHVYSYPLHAYGEDSEPAGYAGWWNLRALPKFNTGNPEVREFIYRIARRWVEFGIDGWRLDVPSEIDDDGFWREFRNVVKSANPEAYIVGEIWGPAERWLQGDMFDGVMNYGLLRACIEFFIGARGDSSIWQGGYGPVSPCDASQFAAQLEGLLGRYPLAASHAMLNLLDSHDTARFVTIAQGDTEALRLATLLQMTYPGAPSIYYGDEVGLPGGRDPDNRRSMPWDKRQWDLGLLAHVRNCVELRRAHPALRTGEFKTLYAERMTYAYARYSADEWFMVVLNAGDRLQVADIHTGQLLPDGSTLKDVWSPQTVTVNRGVAWDVVMPPRSGVVFELVQRPNAHA